MQTHTFPASFVPRRPFSAPFGLMAPLYDGAGDGGAGGQGGNGGAGGAGAGGNGGGNGAGGDGGGGTPKMLSISEEEFEQRIVGRIKQAESTWKKANTVSTLTAEERVELEQSRKDREEAKRKELESKGQYDAALKAQEESIRKPYEEQGKKSQERIDGLTGRLRTAIVTNSLLSAAAAGNAYDAKQVVALNERFVKLDDEFNPTVVDEHGQPRFVAGKPMTQEQLIAEFLTANPHMVKAPAGMQGGGASGGASRQNVQPTELDALEQAVKDAEAAYKRSRSTADLTKHRAAVKAWHDAKRKAA